MKPELEGRFRRGSRFLVTQIKESPRATPSTATRFQVPTRTGVQFLRAALDQNLDEI
jgi:hypothetical protein